MARTSAVAAAAAVAAVLVAGAHSGGGTGHRGMTAADARAVAFARAQLGKPYVWGAEGPGAFDCSGLVMRAWQSAGRMIPRTSQEQWAQLRHVSRSDMRPGDLMFYAGSDGTVTSPGHVVIYIGHGKVIQAYAPGTPIEVSPLASMDAGGFTGVARP